MIFASVIAIAATAGITPAAQTSGSQSIDLLWPNGAPGDKGSEDGDKPTPTTCLPDNEKATDNDN